MNFTGVDSGLDNFSARVLIFCAGIEVDSSSTLIEVSLANKSLAFSVPLKLKPSISRRERSPLMLIWLGVGLMRSRRALTRIGIFLQEINRV